MKKILSLLLVLMVFTGCGRNDNQEVVIPKKETSNDNSTITTPINALNLDQYLFRDDVQYVDLREMSLIVESGYIAGFQFIPFHSLIASFRDTQRLYKMKDTKTEDGEWIYAGSIGGFYPQYIESKQIIRSLFDEDKYIFFVSQAGSEGSYIINLLIQLGYDGDKLYNICGVTGTEGAASFTSKGNKKYFVEGNTLINIDASYDIEVDLTPIVE